VVARGANAGRWRGRSLLRTGNFPNC